MEDDHTVVFTPDPLDPESVDDYVDAAVVSVFIRSELDADLLARLDNLQFVATRSTGFDHIDLAYCSAHEIAVSNVPSYGDNTVAEHTMGLLLTISHHLRDALERTRRGDFSLQGLRGFDLAGKVLGVVGAGAIGRRVIEMAKGFRMHVLAYDVVEDEDLATELGFRYASLEETLAQADVVTLHVPANAQTRHLLDEAEFAQMKEGVILLNTSRGEVVKTEALVEALTDGTVAAAGLDVLPEEPTIREEAELLRTVYRQEHDLDTLLAGHLLMRLSNVYITPHSAFYTREAVQRILDTTVGNIQGFLKGEERNLVTDGA